MKFSKTPYLLLALTVLLVACGGGSSGGGNDNGGGNGDGSSPAISVNGISGIAYQIGDRAGVVRPGTAIPYTSGEQIHFKLGNLTIATVPAKDSVSVVDLFPVLPATAKDMRVALRLAYDQAEERLSMPTGLKEYSYGGVPVLHRTSNLMQLLLAMDHDADPANGLDLLTGDWATKLADFNENTLPLNSDLRNFLTDYRTRAFSQVNNLPMSMDIAKPLVTLYQIAGIRIDAKAVSGFNTPNVTPGTTGEFTFDSEMRLASVKSIGSSTTTTQYSYDNAGNISRELSETDQANNGSVDSSKEYTRTFSAFGAQLTFDGRNRDINNDLTQHTRKESSTLENRLLVTNTVSTDMLDNAANYSADEFSYNDSGFITQRDYLEFDSSDVLLDEQPQASYQYTQGVLAEFKAYSYSGSTLSSTTTQTYTNSNDGGNPVTTMEGVYRNANNEVMGDSYRFTETFVDGRLVSADYHQFSGAIDSSILSTKTIQYEYDAQGRVTSCTWQNNNAGKGRNRFIYGQDGLLSEVTGETYDSELNAFQDDGDERIYTYGNDGELTYASRFNKAFVYGSENVTNGVAYLIHELKLLDDQIGRRSDSCYFFWF